MSHRAAIVLASSLCACAHARPELAAVHLGWASSGIASPEEELVVRSDGLACTYIRGELEAWQLPEATTQQLFADLARTDLPLRPSSWSEVGRVPGGGGCEDPSTTGSIMTLAERGKQPRTVRVLVERPNGFHKPLIYLEGDERVDVVIDAWWRRIGREIDAASHADASACADMRLDGTTPNGHRRTNTRRFWRQ